MIIQACWKDPDALNTGLEIYEMDNKIKLTKEERDKFFNILYNEMHLGEYIVLEIDTEKKTIVFKESY